MDFGTAASKAAIGRQTNWDSADGPQVQPLPLGHFAGHSDPLLVPSALYLNDDRIFFGPAALKRASRVNGGEPLQSFKMLLGAADLASLLDSAVKKTTDPSGRFTNRSILTLYIAYLSALIGACFDNDPSLAAIKPDLRWRYSRPDWPNSKVGEHDKITKAVFEKAIHVGAALSDELLSADGVDISRALDALDAPTPDLGDLIEGGVFEAHAAGAAHAGGATLSSSFIMVFDVGAGTTDFEGFKYQRTAEGLWQAHEIASARRSIGRAGDEVDKILMNAFIDKAGLGKSVKAQAALWRSMSASIRDIKRQAFLQEKCAVRMDNKSIILTRKQLQGGKDFREFVAALEAHFHASLAAVAAAAKAEKIKSVSLILAGGGAALPFVQEMAKKAERTWRKDARVVLEPLAPAWAHGSDYSAGLAALFPQLEVAIGGTSPMIRIGPSEAL